MRATTFLPCVLTALAASALLACSDDLKPFPEGLTERDKTAMVDRPIDGANGQSIRFTRTRDDGWRKVEVSLGGTVATFHDDPALIMLDANGQGFGARTVICGMASADPKAGSPLGILCSVAEGGALGPVHKIFNAEHSWLFDVCTEGDKVTLLYSIGPRPIDPDAPAGPVCQAQTWQAATGWAAAPAPAGACTCALRDGQACTDPCFVGAGVRRDGECDVTGLPPACNDGNAATQDFCTGLADQLCYTKPVIPPMP